MALVSVAMSVFNGAKYLSESVESVLSQTLGDFEFIIVDDGSTDGTPGILDEISSRDRRVRIIRNASNIGLTKSLIRAAGISQGKYIARQDADDVSLPDRLQKQFDFLEANPAYGAVGTSAAVIDDKGDVIRRASVPRHWLLIRLVLKFGNCFLHGSMMLRRSDYLEAGGYREAFAMGQDFDLWLRISSLKKMGNLKEELYLWRETSGSISSMKRDKQFRIGALALYDSRYNKGLDLTSAIEIDDFISGLGIKERRQYDRCLRDLYIRHRKFSLAEEYFRDQGILDRMLVKAAAAIMGDPGPGRTA